MTVLDRSELQESPLSDLHLIASQLGVEGFRRLRKAELVDAILSHQTAGDELGSAESAAVRPQRARRSRSAHSSRAGGVAVKEEGEREHAERKGRASAARSRRSAEAVGGKAADRKAADRKAADRKTADRKADHRAAGREAIGREASARETGERTAEGTVEILGNGSAFLRVHPPESSEDDVYVSAAQVRRCELVSGDRVGGPVRTPRRSERYPSLIRIETINGQPADSVVEGTRYEELPVDWPSERIAFDFDDPTLAATEQLTPIGLGSRALIAGAARAGKTETLRHMLSALAGREGIELMLVLSGVRPEEICEWQEGPVPPLTALNFAAPSDAQGQAVEGVVETAKRLAARGGQAVVLIDGLDGLHPHVARRVLAAARKLRAGGSLTVIATASRPFGGETTVIALDAAAAGGGRLVALDLATSGALKAELLVGAEGAEAIAKARAAATEG